MSVETPSPEARRLDGVQALRGVAALLVVVFHAAAVWREQAGAPRALIGPWDQGYAGVDLFFVISGFIMVWVAAQRPRGARTAARFAFSRATRIYPLWWVFCGLMAAYFMASYGQPAAPRAGAVRGPWAAFAGSMLLSPQGELPVLQVGWTLVFELAFYAVFALLLLLVPPRWRPAALAAWGAVLLIRLAAGGPAPAMPGSWAGVLLHPLCLEFLLGAAVGYAVAYWRDEGWAKFIALAGGLSFSAMLLAGLDVADPDFAAARVLAFGVPGALLLAGLVKAEEGGLAVPAALVRLGDQSYALYLSHFITLLAWKRATAVPGWLDGASAASMAGFMVSGTALSLIIGWAAHRTLERPLLRGARALWPKPARPAHAR